MSPRWMLVAGLFAFGGCKDAERERSVTTTTTVTPAVTTTKEDAGREVGALVPGQCLICHTSEYVEQQRLTPAQWAGTVKKMIGWGAPISDAQGEALAKRLAETHPADRPDDPRPLVPTPGVGP